MECLIDRLEYEKKIVLSPTATIIKKIRKQKMVENGKLDIIKMSKDTS